MFASWINRLGHWNPQLLREYRGRLKTQSVIAAICLSGIGQLLLIVGFLQQEGVPPTQKWSSLWITMTWILPYLLFTIGSYYLISDLTQEDKRGTLNFIRLSPRPAWQILLGKLLGVPVLPYLTTLLALPLHWVAAWLGGIPFTLVLSSYGMLIVGCLFCYSASMLYALLGSVQLSSTNQQTTTSIVFAAIALIFLAPAYMWWNILITWQPLAGAGQVFGIDSSPVTQVYWAYLPLNTEVWLSHGFTLVNVAISVYIMWRLLLRRFRQPRSTFLSKRQSYGILAYVLVLLLGCFLQPAKASNSDWAAAAIMYYVTLFLLLTLILGVCPQRQALLDWSRYSSHSWQSLIWADKSPALVAIGIQVAIATALLLPWQLIDGFGAKYPLMTLLTFLVVINVVLIAGAFVQLVLSTKIRHPLAWAVGGLALWLIVPPTLLTLLRLFPQDVPLSNALWVFLGYPAWQFPFPTLLPTTIVGILAQWLLLAALLWQLHRTLKNLSRSIN